MDPELERLLIQAVQLDRRLARAVRPYPDPADPRGRLTVALARVAIQHGRAIASLLYEGLDHGALALLRSQSEAIARSYWVQYAAKENWIQRANRPPKPAPKIEPEEFPRFAQLPKDLEAAGHSEHAKLIRDDYNSTKDQMNAYTHGGLRAVWLTLGGLDDEARCFTLRLATSKLALGWSRIAMLSAKGNPVPRIARAAIRYRDCQVWAPKTDSISGWRSLLDTTFAGEPWG